MRKRRGRGGNSKGLDLNPILQVEPGNAITASLKARASGSLVRVSPTSGSLAMSPLLLF